MSQHCIPLSLPLFVWSFAMVMKTGISSTLPVASNVQAVCATEVGEVSASAGADGTPARGRKRRLLQQEVYSMYSTNNALGCLSNIDENGPHS